MKNTFVKREEVYSRIVELIDELDNYGLSTLLTNLSSDLYVVYQSPFFYCIKTKNLGANHQKGLNQC